MSTRSIAAAGVALLLATALPAVAGEPPPSTKYYPSTCGTATLQLCVGGAVPGDTILIDTDEPILESITIGKNLTLGAAPGSDPTIDGGVAIAAAFANISVTIRDLDVIGAVTGAFTGGPGHVIVLERLLVMAPPGASGIDVATNQPGTYTVRSSTVVGSSGGIAGIRLDLLHDGGSTEAAIVGNRVIAPGVPDSGTGIHLRAWGDGVTHAAIANNVVWRVAKADSGAAGILVRLRSTLVADVDVVGNSVVRSGGDGLRVQDQIDPLGVAAVHIFDNVFARTGASGVDIVGPLDGDLTVRAGSNAFSATTVANRWNGSGPGRTFDVAQPGFVDEPAGDLTLKAGSPLVDLGVACPPGGVVNLDAAGNGRLAGPSIDVGAYERKAAAPTGVVIVGTGGGDGLVGSSGADIICGMGGADAIGGGDGRDHVDGGAGADVVLTGQGGPDRVFGGRGDDVCLYGVDGIGGNDRLDGGPGIDGALGDEFDVLIRTEGPPEVCAD